MNHEHKEAYCLMKYQTMDKLETEYIWNSRDGVTPFGVKSRNTKKDLFHVDWEKDQYLPNYIPPMGSRVFVDLTVEIARRMATQMVEEHWKELQKSYPDKESAIEYYVKYWMEPGAPAVITSEEYHASCTNHNLSDESEGS
jgi:hypothetical protein